MSKKIKIINTSGSRIPKKPKINESDMMAFGYNTDNNTYYQIPVDLSANQSQITVANIITSEDALNVITVGASPSYDNNIYLNGNLISTGGNTIIELGAVWNTSGLPTIDDNVVLAGSPPYSLGAFQVNCTGLSFFDTTYLRAFAIATGTTSGQTVTEIIYGGQVSGQPVPCLIKGTLITLSDWTYKKIEDITYNDSLLVWNFDEGKFDSAKPFWIAKPSKSSEYNVIKFNDGTKLKTVTPSLGHRILNIEKGTFSYPMLDDSPLGTKTFTEKNKNIYITDKRIVKKEATFYNIITDKHINMFANGILTSCRLNNIYPIKDMKFIKSEKELKIKGQFGNISESAFEGLRLSEQNFSVEDLKKYMSLRNIK